MPNGDEFLKKLTEWEAEALRYETEAKVLETRSENIQAQIQALQEPAAEVPLWRRVLGGVPLPGLFGVSAPYPITAEHIITPFQKLLAEKPEVAPLLEEYAGIQSDYFRGIFYIDLYRTIPSAIFGGQVNSVDEALNIISIPENLTADEMAAVREAVSEMFSVARGEELTTEERLAELGEAPELMYPELVAPALVRVPPTTIHQLSIQELVKAMKAPVVPESAMSEAEWKEYLSELGWSEEDIDREKEITAEALVADALNRKAMIEEYKANIAEVPEYKITDFLKELVVQPPLAVLEALNYYYEHVSMPGAFILYGVIGGIDDIEKAYWEFKHANPDASFREAAVYAWRKWEAPGPIVLDFILKWIIMEGITDPLTYVGWGIYSRAAKFLGPVGKPIIFAERALAELFEMPFDAIKWLVKGLPKTVAGRASGTARNSAKVLDQYITKFTGKPLSFVQMDEFADGFSKALDHFVANPRATDDIARVGMEMCRHAPVDDVLMRNWIPRFRALGVMTFDPETITAQGLKNVDDIFEKVFLKEITADEAAPYIIKLLGVSQSTDDAVKLAARLLQQRTDGIIGKALVFTGERTPLGAMRSYIRATTRLGEVIERSAVTRYSQQVGRFTVLLEDIPQSQLGIWRRKIDDMVVRPAAQSYLTFGMYGPMNTLEDCWRSIMGGIRPGRASIEAIDIETIGLRIDPELRIWGLSEMIGPLKKTPLQPTRNNWILTMAELPLSLPTYAATRGRVTPAAFARKSYAYLVEFFGGLGMDIRRNFVIGRNRQLLAELGGDAYQSLAKAGPREVPTEVTQKWLRKLVANDVYRGKVTGKLHSGAPDFIDTLKARFTKDRITRGEVVNLVSQYPDISHTSRNLVTQLYDDGTLMRSADSIDDAMRKTVWANEVDDFLKGPEVAARQYEQLADVLKKLEVRNPEDMAQLILSVQQMTKTYGGLPRQIMGRATVKSRGLPIAERRAAFDIDFDRIHMFMEKAGVNIDGVIDSIRTKMVRPPATVTAYRGGAFRKTVGRTATEGEGLYISGSRAFAEGFGEVTDIKYLKPKNPLKPEPCPGVLAKNVLPEWSDIKWMYDPIKVSDSNWVRLVKQSAKDVGITDDALWVSRAAQYNKHLTELMVSEGYDAVVVPKAAAWDEFTVLLDDALWKDVIDRVPFTEGYQSAADDVLNILTTMREYSTEFRMQNMASRHEIFAGATKANLKSGRWWDDFYLQMDGEVMVFNKRIAELNGRLVNATQNLNTAAGVKIPPRPRVVVKNRPLAPNDVARLIQTKNDDVSRMLLDVLTAEGDRDFFVEYVMGMVREGYDVGFTREAVGEVYDQICYSLRVDPNSSSWLRAREMELDGLTRQLHDLYNSKLLPDGEVTAIGRYIDDTAKAVDDVMYEAPGKLRPEYVDYDDIRQRAWDGAEKWYYKEYPDYTNANALDSTMKAIYPFWTYESQRWFWLPRSFFRRPGTLTTFGRWQNNTEYGYVHIPGTAVDWNPARGTVYGPWTTRLMRRDYPEYYDQLEGASGLIEFSDFLSRYGFYPNVIFGAALSAFGGREQQMGGILPSMYNTPLQALIAAFPDSESVNFISETIFPNRFRDYLTSRRVDDFGGDGSLIHAKREAGQALTPEEEDFWTTARQSVAIHSTAFEQFGMFRMRTDEAYRIYEEAGRAIEEMTGFTPEQQRWLRMHGYNTWDQIGGLDPWQSAALQELDYFKYVGSIRPLLPGRQQEILNKIELDWAAVRSYSEEMNLEILNLQQDFLTGSERGRLGPRDFLTRVRELLGDRRKYIDKKVEKNPLMLLENRTEYYEKYGQPMPVQSPMNELMSLFFSIELEETVEEGTGARIYDWDKFWANRGMIDAAIPDAYRADWNDYLTRNTAPMMIVWRDVYEKYFKKYYGVWEATFESYPEEEQGLLTELFFLERTGQKLERQAEIKSIVSAKTGRMLESSFRSEVSDNRAALRWTNPILDAWLFFWGRTTSFKTPQAETIYKQLARDTGRVIE